METASGGQVPDELLALGKLPSESELSTLIERYAGSRRVTCELADEFLASVGEVVPPPQRSAAEARAAREVEEVAGGSWLEKIGSASSAPPRAPASVPARAASAADPRPRRSTLPPVLSLTPVPPQPEPMLEAVSVEQALEHLPAATYGTLPPPSALPSLDSAPIALPLSSRPPLVLASQPPAAAEPDSVVLEQWGSLGPSPIEAKRSSAPPLSPKAEASVPAASRSAAPVSSVEEALLSAEEDALLDQWSDDDRASPSESVMPLASESRASQSDVAPSADEPEPWNAPDLGAERSAAARADDAPLSAAELSLLDQWPGAPDAPATAAKPESAITGGFAAADYAAAVYAPSESRFPRARTRPQQAPVAVPAPSGAARMPSLSAPPRLPAAQSTTTSRPPLPAAALSVPRPAATAAPDVELEEEIELDPDDLIELDNE